VQLSRASEPDTVYMLSTHLVQAPVFVWSVCCVISQGELKLAQTDTMTGCLLDADRRLLAGLPFGDRTCVRRTLRSDCCVRSTCQAHGVAAIN
jgi:hypothetical protein